MSKRFMMSTAAVAAMLSLGISAHAQNTGAPGAGGAATSPAPSGSRPAAGAPAANDKAAPAPSGSAAPAAQGTSKDAAKPSSAADTKPATDTGAKSTGASDSKSSTDSKSTASSVSSATNISTEERAKVSSQFQSVQIREATNINITSVSLGTVVPTTIETYWQPVPETIIRIVPAWRSYRVVKVKGQLLIIEPSTRKIVYVIAS